MAHLLKDFPPSPLDRYRKRASFDWKKLKVFLDTEDSIHVEHFVYEELQKYPQLFDRSSQTPLLDKRRRATANKMFIFKLISEKVLQLPYCTNLTVFRWKNVICTLDPDAAYMFGLIFDVFIDIITMMGTERHKHYLEQAHNGDIFGCLCITEVGHGSNTKGLRTTATYDKDRKQFIIHTADFQAAKCWVGTLGNIVTHAIIFAQLIMPDGFNYGLHSFVVNIRDTKTLLPNPGVTVGDIGEKVGLNGIANGLLMFNHYAIPRQNLLNKNSDVTEGGEYVTSIEDPIRRHGVALSTLSMTRITVVSLTTTNLLIGITIAVRYAAVRKQFSPDDNEDEVSILEYQTHQYRLLPHLALAFALKTFEEYALTISDAITELLKEESASEDVSALGLEIHAIAAAAKPVAVWSTRDALQEFREACGGHGYLKASRLGDLRNNGDANITIEGENHVLIQQTSHWLLKFWPLILQGETIKTPLNSVDFLNEAKQILRQKFAANSVEQLIQPNIILSTFQWLVCYLLQSSYEKSTDIWNNTPGSEQAKRFWARSKIQIFYAKNLSIAYIQHLILQNMYSKICKSDDPKIKKVLLNLFSLFGVYSLQKHIPILYRGGYATNPATVRVIQESILKLCESIKDEAVALVDVIAQPDWVINSVLGNSDGEVYKHLEATILQQPGAFSRPDWWKEVVNWRSYIAPKL